MSFGGVLTMLFFLSFGMGAKMQGHSFSLLVIYNKKEPLKFDQ